jgi:N-acetylneuraminate synthase
MDAAALAGADAIKLQTYTADTLTLDHDGPDFRISAGTWAGRRLYDLYKEACTPWEWHEQLFLRGKELGITVFSSPFDPSAVAFLEGMNVPAYKIASFEAIDLPLIELIASKGKPVIASTGLANLGEIEELVSTCRKAGASQLALLHCISAYPAPPEEANLQTIPHLQAAFQATTGLSDHTLGTATAVAAVALGASIIEKHLTLLRADGGPDADFSLEPGEFARLVQDCKTAWAALGRVHYEIKGSEQGSIVFRRSLYVTQDVPEGAILDQSNVRSIRPGYGLPPKTLPEVLGRRAARDLRRGEALRWGMLK